MKKKSIKIALLFLVCLLLLACEYEYVTYTLEATAIWYTEDYMRSEGWKIVKKEGVGERVYERDKQDKGWYSNSDSPYFVGRERKQDVIILYAVTFRRQVP